MRQRLRDFFFPPPESSFTRHLMPFASIGAMLAVILLVIPPAWEYSNSAAFCGTTCHTMPPEYSTYLTSPHARVLCVDCHIGRDLIAVQFYRKIGHMRLVVATLLENYEYPIRAGVMSPARETCEQCHFPEKFSDDSLREITRFDSNRTNDEYQIYLLMHTGGGSEREGLGRGIHWHVENNITYIATDPEKQEIPWIRVEAPDGTITEYNSINSPVDTSDLDQYKLEEMDCITCHNRIAHSIESPVDTVDSALSVGDISTDIPFIRARAVELLSQHYGTTDQAKASFATLDEYYQANYVDFYAEGSDLVQQAIDTLNKIYVENNYPEQELTWDTHPNNVGHRDSAGCFRCHDGQHFSPEGEVIRLECNLCHSIPQIVRPGEIEPMLPLATGIEPPSHLTSTWISQHHNIFDLTCTNCHETSNPGGTTNTSFCSNSGCHGVKWEYAGFDAPGLATMLGIFQVEPEPLLEEFTGDPTYAVLQPLFEQQCGACHGPIPSKDLRLTDYARLMAGGSDGPVVVPGSPTDSLMIQVLTKGHFARLTKHQMELLTQWIANGAPES